MSSGNPFADVGSILSGERVIGRNKEIDRLHSRLCSDSGYGSIAVIGMPRIGKSSLVQRAFLDEVGALASSKLRIICTRVNVATRSSIPDLLSTMVRETLRVIRDFKLTVQEIEIQGASVFVAKEDTCWDETYSFFRLLRRSQIRPVCVLDEFDSVRSLLRVSHAPRHFSCLRELGSGSEYKVGLVLVCKRGLSEISKLAGFSSDYWHNATGNELYLRGFSESELDCYFEKLEQAGVGCTDEGRGELARLSGSHPYLLDLFASEAFSLPSGTKTLGGAECRELMMPLLPKAFSQLVEVLRDGPWLAKLKQVLLGGGVRSASSDFQALVRYGALVKDRNGKLLPFASTLPDYLRSLDCDFGAVSPTTQEAKEACGQPTAKNSKGRPSQTTENSFCREGSGWRVCYERKWCVVPHSDGFAYIAKLIKSQPHSVTIAELRTEVGKHDVASFTEADDAADDPTLRAAKRKLRELKDALANAENTGNSEQAEEVKAELAELARAFSQRTYRNKSKKIGDPDKTVANAIGNAIGKAIVLLKNPDHHPELARHLKTHLLRPYSPNPCYAPSPKVDWEIVLQAS